jgi:hypothetical protein
MNETNDGIHDYLLLPGDHPFYILRFSKTNAAKLGAISFATIEKLSTSLSQTLRD